MIDFKPAPPPNNAPIRMDWQKREQAFLLRVEGLTYKQIGEKMGIDKTRAMHFVNAACRRRMHCSFAINQYPEHHRRIIYPWDFEK